MCRVERNMDVTIGAKWCIKAHEGRKWYVEIKIGTEWCIKAHMRTDGRKNKHRDKERYRRVYITCWYTRVKVSAFGTER